MNKKEINRCKGACGSCAMSSLSGNKRKRYTKLPWVSIWQLPYRGLWSLKLFIINNGVLSLSVRRTRYCIVPSTQVERKGNKQISSCQLKAARQRLLMMCSVELVCKAHIFVTIAIPPDGRAAWRRSFQNRLYHRNAFRLDGSRCVSRYIKPLGDARKVNHKCHRSWKRSPNSSIVQTPLPKPVRNQADVLATAASGKTHVTILHGLFPAHVLLWFSSL